MSDPIVNHVSDMFTARGKIVRCFGLDQTGKIEYKFNDQGFRAEYSYDFEPDIVFFGCSLVFGIGVQYQDTFGCRFDRSHNYGLASNYRDKDILLIIEKYLDLKWKDCPKIVVWKNLDGAITSKEINKLSDYRFYHFFCGEKVQAPRCYRMVPDLDKDLSGTHPGPKSHDFFYQTICKLLNL